MLLTLFNRIGIALLLLGIGACGSAPVSGLQPEQTMEVDRLVDNKTFRIESDWAQPLVTNSMAQIGGLLPPGSTAGRINLIGNSNFFLMEGDSVSAYLPYYGERQAGGGFGANGAIQFNGIPKGLEVKKDPKTQGYRMNFNINEKGENYSVTVQLYPNLKSHITVNSSQRFFIRYDGKVEALEEKETF